MRTRLFVSYSRVDRDWKERLQMHLATLQRRGFVDVWSDSRIAIGQSWQQDIDAALMTAKIAALLVSPAFMASEYVWTNEMPKLLEHQRQGMRILPVIARPCAWRLSEELAPLEARPASGTPLSVLPEAQADLQLATLAYELGRLLEVTPKGVPPQLWEDWARPE